MYNYKFSEEVFIKENIHTHCLSFFSINKVPAIIEPVNDEVTHFYEFHFSHIGLKGKKNKRQNRALCLAP